MYQPKLERYTNNPCNHQEHWRDLSFHWKARPELQCTKANTEVKDIFNMMLFDWETTQKEKVHIFAWNFKEITPFGLNNVILTMWAESMEVAYYVPTPRIPDYISVKFPSPGKPVCPHLAWWKWAVPSFACMIYSMLQVWLPLLCRRRTQTREKWSNLSNVAREVSNKSTTERLQKVCPGILQQLLLQPQVGSYKHPVVLNYFTSAFCDALSQYS